MICRVGRVTECGGEVGRLNVVGGAEVCSFAFCGHSKFSHLFFAVGRQRVVFIEKQPACFFVVVQFLVQYSFFFRKTALGSLMSVVVNMAYIELFNI